MLSLEKRRQRSDMIIFKYLKGCHTEEGQDLFSIIPEFRKHNNGLKLQEARFLLNIRKNILTVRAAQQWNQLPWEVVSAPTLEAFKINLRQPAGRYPLICISALSRGLDLMALYPSNFTIL